MVQVFRTDDLEFVTFIMRSCFEHLADDSTPADQEASPDHTHVLIRGDDTLGVFSVHPLLGHAWGLHVVFAPGLRREVKQGLQLAVQWVREHTPANSLVGIAECGKPGIAAVARVIGLKRVGTLQRAFLRGSGTDVDIWQVML